MTDSDLADAIRSRWADLAAAGEIGAIVPAARVYREIVAEGTPLPNARLRIEEADCQTLTSGKRIRRFMVTIEVYDSWQEPRPGPIAQALDTFVGRPGSPAGGLTLPAQVGRMVWTRKEPGGGVQVAPERIDGHPILMVRAKFSAVCEDPA